jgi:hypothetical protein
VGLGASGPARATSCGTANGVTVVVDFHQLGGGVKTACDLHGAGRTADIQLTDVGHQLTYVQRQPGFVCRVDGAPANDPCVNTPPSDAYWSLWWSDGKSGRWSYSSAGVASLKVPAGGYVALSWQGGGGKATPRTAPVPHPTSSPTPTHPPTSHPTAAPTSATPTPTTSSPRPSRSTTSAAKVRHHHLRALRASAGRHSQGPSATRAGAAPSRAATGSDSGSGLPGWVAPGVVALLFAATAAVAVVRRKRSGGA